MDAVHLTIGMVGVVALIVVITNSASEVGFRVAGETGTPISNLVARGDPVSDQLTAVELPLVEGDYMDATCSVVQNIASTACDFVGPLLPKPRNQTCEEDTTAEKKDEPDPAANPPAEE